MTNQIVFLSPRGFGSAALENRVLDRLSLYLKSLGDLVNFDFYIFLPGAIDSKKLVYEQIGQIRIIRLGQEGNFLIYTFKAIYFSKKLGLSPDLIVAGDVRFAFLSSIIFRFLNLKSKLQIQIHGNYSSLFISRYFPRFMINCYYYFAFRFATSIRMVSPHQLQSFPSFLQTKIRKLVIAEIPYLSAMPDKAKREVPRSIGFVGRIHRERGLDRWIEIANRISGIDREVTFVVIGDGLDREVFFNGFDLETRSKVRYLGWLNSIDLDTAWNAVGVLLVTADSESFGVVMREALVRGIFVVAFENQASLSLKKQFPNCVFTSSNIQDLADLAITYCARRLPDNAVESIMSTLVAEQKTSIQAVAKSWLQDLQSH